MIVTRTGVSSALSSSVLGLVLSAWLVIPGSLSAAVSHRTIEWTSADGEPVATALLFSDVTPNFMVSRMLVEAPSGGHVVLTDRIEPSTGSTTLRLDHEATGWWLEVHVGMGLDPSGLEGFFDQANEALEKPGATLNVEVRTSDGHDWTGEVPVLGAQIQTSLAALGRQLRGEAIGRVIESAISPGLAAALDFVRRELTLGRPGESFRTIAELLAPWLPAAAEAAPESDRLVRKDGEFRMGPDLEKDRFVRLLERFPSIDPQDPTGMP